MISALDIPIDWLPNSPYDSLNLRVSNTELLNQSSLLAIHDKFPEGKIASEVALANLDVSSFLTVSCPKYLPPYDQLAVARREKIEFELEPA